MKRLLTLLLLTIPAIAHAQITWTGPSSGYWTNASNWDAGQYPGQLATNAAIIPEGVTVTLDTTPDYQVPAIDLAGHLFITNTVDTGTTALNMTNNSRLTVATGSTWLNPPHTGTKLLIGTNIVVDVRSNAVWRASTIYLGRNMIDGNYAIGGGGTILLNGGGLYVGSSNALPTSGNVAVVDGMRLERTQFLVGAPSPGNTLILTNTYMLTAFGGSFRTGSSAPCSSNTVVLTGPDTLVDTRGSYFYTANGAFSTGCTLRIENDAVLTNSYPIYYQMTVPTAADCQENAVLISDGGKVFGGGWTIGATRGHSNRVEVTGNDSVLDLIGWLNLSVGNSSSVTGNTLRVADNGEVRGILGLTVHANNILDFTGGRLAAHDFTYNPIDPYVLGDGCTFVMQSGPTPTPDGIWTFAGGLLVDSNATLTGRGILRGAGITITNGATLIASKDGTLTTTNLTWAGGAVFTPQVDRFNSRPGSGWGLLNVATQLTFTAASPNHVIKLDSDGSVIPDFEAGRNYAFRIVEAGLMNGLNLSNIMLDTNSLLLAETPLAEFKLTNFGSKIFLTYSGSPESHDAGGFTWNAARSGNWSDGANLTNGTAPSSDAGTVLEFSGNSGLGDLSHLRWRAAHAWLWDASATGLNINPRDGYGLALSPGATNLYLGFNNPSGTESVLRIRREPTAATTNSFATNLLARLYGYRGKGIATDDQGRVYLAEGSSAPGFGASQYVWWPTGGSPVTNATPWVQGINIFSPDLSTKLYSIDCTNCEGVVTRREEGNLYLYATDRTLKTLSRILLSESGGAITGHTPDGEMTNSLATQLRGLDIDSNGRIWMADTAGNTVWRCDSDGENLQSNVFSRNIADVSCLGDRVYASSYQGTAPYGEIYVLDATTLQLIATLPRPPAAQLGFGPDDQGSFGQLEALSEAEGIYVQMNAGAGIGLTEDANWKNPLVHITGATRYFATNDIANPFDVNKLLLTSAATATNVLAGDPIRFNGTDAGVWKNSGGSFVISNELFFTTNAHFLGTEALEGAVTLATNITVAGDLVKKGNWTLVCQGSNAVSGNIILDSLGGGGIALTGTGQLWPTGDIIVSNGILSHTTAFTLGNLETLHNVSLIGEGALHQLTGAYNIGSNATVKVEDGAQIKSTSSISVNGSGTTAEPLSISGGQVYSLADSFIGATNDNNAVTISNGGLWDCGQKRFYVGCGTGSSNTLVLDNGTLAGADAVWVGGVSGAQGGNYNGIVITNGGYLWPNLLSSANGPWRIGSGTNASYNFMDVRSGGWVKTYGSSGNNYAQPTIGFGPGAVGNWLRVDGGRIVAVEGSNRTGIRVGGGRGAMAGARNLLNHLDIVNGGFVQFNRAGASNSQLDIGAANGAASNYVYIAGAGSTYNLEGQLIAVGWYTGNTGNYLRVEDNGRVENANGLYVGSSAAVDSHANFISVSNATLVSGVSGSQAAVAGSYRGRGNYIEILKDAYWSHSGPLYIGGGTDAAASNNVDNYVLLDGSSVENITNIRLGSGTGTPKSARNRLILTNNASLRSVGLVHIGYSSGCHSNWISVADSTWDLAGQSIVVGIDSTCDGNYLHVGPGAQLTRVEDLSVNTNNRLQMAGGRIEARTATINGALTGSGVVQAATTIRGMLSPGNSPGALTNIGPVTLMAGSTSRIEIAAHTTPGVGWDFLSVSNGALTLGGNLRVVLTDGFVPSDAQTFTIMTHADPAGVSGTFENLVGNTVDVYVDETEPPVARFHVSITPQGVVLDQYGITHYNIAAGAGVGGTTDPAGIVAVIPGGTTSFVVTAAAYYDILSIETNNAQLIPGPFTSPYTSLWTDVGGTGYISAAFAPRLAARGTPEWWLAQFRDWTNNFDTWESTDWDGDGLTGWEEYLASSDPTNALSTFVIHRLGEDSGTNWLQWVCVFPDPALPPFLVQQTTNLTGGVWGAASPATGPRAQGTNTWHSDVATPNIPPVYYRIVGTNMY